MNSHLHVTPDELSSKSIETLRAYRNGGGILTSDLQNAKIERLELYVSELLEAVASLTTKLNEEGADIKPPLDVKDADHVRTDAGLEFGPVSVDKHIWFGSNAWHLDGLAHTQDLVDELGNIIEVTKRRGDE